jgi:predicted Zn-ribbon and HTH transcriptional regulator
MIDGKIYSLSSFKHPLIYKKVHVLVVYPCKCKKCSYKAVN